ncbi:MAG: hypothetical protein ABIY55_35020 [Kofleriaceae bacterium]
MLDRGQKMAPERLELSAGELVIEVPARVTTISALVASREILAAPLVGAKVRVRFDAARRSPSALGLTVAVDDGEARFSTRGAWHRITRGQVVEALADQTVSTPSALPAAPEWAATIGQCGASPTVATARRPADCPIAVVTSDAEVASLTMAWSDVAAASGYRVEVATDETFARVIARGDTVERLFTTPLPTGRYFARVAGLGAQRMPGPASAARELRVVRVELPAGTVAREDAWMLPPGSARSSATRRASSSRRAGSGLRRRRATSASLQKDRARCGCVSPDRRASCASSSRRRRFALRSG